MVKNKTAISNVNQRANRRRYGCILVIFQFLIRILFEWRRSSCCFLLCKWSLAYIYSFGLHLNSVHLCIFFALLIRSAVWFILTSWCNLKHNTNNKSYNIKMKKESSDRNWKMWIGPSLNWAVAQSQSHEDGQRLLALAVLTYDSQQHCSSLKTTGLMFETDGWFPPAEQSRWSPNRTAVNDHISHVQRQRGRAGKKKVLLLDI